MSSVLVEILNPWLNRPIRISTYPKASSFLEMESLPANSKFVLPSILYRKVYYTKPSYKITGYLTSSLDEAQQRFKGNFCGKLYSTVNL